MNTRLLFAAVVVVTSACNRNQVDLKNDTPAAAVTSLIKIYEHKKYDKLGEVVDPLFGVEQARNMTCFPERRADGECTERMLEAAKNGTVLSNPPNCTIGAYAKCACGSKRGDIEKKAAAFVATGEHEDFIALNPTIKTCRVLDTVPVGDGQYATDLQNGLCEDELGTNFAAVTFQCKDVRLVALLRQNPRSKAWGLVMLPLDTEATLIAIRKSAGKTGDAPE